MRQRIIAAARCCGTRIAQVALAACALQLVACTVVPVNPDLPAPGYEPRQISNAQRPVLGLVLGSGASRGFAHIGVIQELEDNGIVPDVIVGTSSGALVGALYAGGFGGRELERIAGAMREDDVRDLMLPGRGFVRGNALQAFVNRQLQSRSIEQLDKPFAAVATDLEDGLPAVFNRGNVGIAVRASSSVPGVFEPVRLAGRDYVDGGLVSPVPIRTARDLGAETVIAVDVSRKPEKGALLEGILSILNQTIAIMGRYIAEREVGNADVLIQPDLQEMSRFDFEQTSLAIQAGREAARRAMPDIRQALQRSALAKARRSRSRP